MMNTLRSTCYHCVLLPLTMLMGLFYLPLLVRRSPALNYFVPYSWTTISLLLQRYVLRLRYRVEGAEHIVREGGVIYAVKHQSAWETLALWHILHRPVFVLKKELLDIPVFGWYLRRVDNIVIDRSAGKHAINQIIEQSRAYLEQGRSIVIFPEGTRTAVGAVTRYKAGIGALYEAHHPTIIPVALNSGCFWKRNAWVRKAGIVWIRFLPPMPQGLPRDAFMEQLQHTIETATGELISGHYEK